MELTPDQFIEDLNKTDSHLTTLYTRGGCYKFALFLQTLYPNGVLYIRKDHKHIVVLIDQKMFDIHGEVGNREYYTKLTVRDIKRYKCDKWSSERNILVMDKKDKNKKFIQIKKQESIVVSVILFLFNSILVALVYLNSVKLMNYKEFLSRPQLSKIVILAMHVIVIVLIIRKMLGCLNKIGAYFGRQ